MPSRYVRMRTGPGDCSPKPLQGVVRSMSVEAGMIAYRDGSLGLGTAAPPVARTPTSTAAQREARIVLLCESSPEPGAGRWPRTREWKAAGWQSPVFWGL